MVFHRVRVFPEISNVKITVCISLFKISNNSFVDVLCHLHFPKFQSKLSKFLYQRWNLECRIFWTNRLVPSNVEYNSSPHSSSSFRHWNLDRNQVPCLTQCVVTQLFSYLCWSVYKLHCALHIFSFGGHLRGGVITYTLVNFLELMISHALVYIHNNFLNHV